MVPNHARYQLRYASKKVYSVYVLWSRVAPTVSAAVRECSRLGHRSGDLMPSLISLGKTAGDRCFGNSSLVLMSRTMRATNCATPRKKIFSLCFMVVGHTHGLGGSKGMQPPRSPLGQRIRLYADMADCRKSFNIISIFCLPVN